ncbi:hypothetical protein C7534_12914 [Pseudomonas sp. OV226]|nr:hypothetical protein C7534_12914 [Pseudomonas sp. OV226]
MSRFSKSLLSTVMLFACVTMRTVTSWEGEPSMMSYGFRSLGTPRVWPRRGPIR